MLDTRTMMVMLVFSTLLSGLLMWLTQRRQQIGQGIVVWAISYFGFALAFLLMALRAYLPELMWTLTPNLIVFAAFGLMAEAVRRALNLPVIIGHRALWLVAAAMLIYLVVVLSGPSHQQRVNAISILLVPLTSYPAVVLLQGSQREERARHFLAASFLLLAALMLLRLLTGISGLHESKGLHEVSWVHSTFYLAVFVIFYCMGIGFMLMAREQLMIDLARRATTDALTGAYNRHAFEPIAVTALAQIDRHQQPVSLLMIDLDHFKQINDRHGHLVGDQVLRSITQLIRAELRAGDVLARWGGEELSLLLPDTDAGAARQIGERLRFLMETTVLPGRREPVRLTASFGLATAQQSVSLSALIHAADLALYQAKANGRNQLCERPVMVEPTATASLARI
ncbi:MAG TPA: GGDEF domain-containing protein [Permianibacter sp.]|nr:GGDEF domain-containing protein [Permianibacter sp.]